MNEQDLKRLEEIAKFDGAAEARINEQIEFFEEELKELKNSLEELISFANKLENMIPIAPGSEQLKILPENEEIKKDLQLEIDGKEAEIEVLKRRRSELGKLATDKLQ